MLLWGILFAVFAVIEVLIPALVSVWLAIAALILVPISFFVQDPLIETVIFSALSLALLLSFRRVFKRFMQVKDTLRKEEVEVVDLSRMEGGHFIYDVRYKGGLWTGISSLEFAVGEMALIHSFEGNKILLEKK